MRKWIGLLLIVAACADDDFVGQDSEGDDSEGSGTETTVATTGTSTGTGTDTDGALVLEDLEAVQNPANALSFFVSWRTSAPAPSRLQVDCGPDFQQTFESDTLVEAHDVFVMGLYDGLACTLTATTGQGDGLSETIELTAGPLPADVPEFTVETLLPNRRAPGWALFNLTNRLVGLPMKMIILDEQGRVRWYHETPEGNHGEDNDLRLVSDGLLLGGTWNNIFTAIYDWEGNQTWVLNRLSHHDARPDGDDENLIWFLSRDDDCPPAFEGLKVDSVHLYDRTLEQDVFQWNICDFHQPPVLYSDWDHLNTIELDGQDGFIVSSRSQHQLFYVSRPSGEVAWILGQAGDFTLEGEDDGEVWFGRQHAPEIQPNGNILLFDNGRDTSREWSRGIEYELDMETMTARKVWEFRPEPDLYARIWGDADRMPNGNTVMVFGRRQDGLDSQIYEADADSEVVWHVTTPPDWGMYRSERIEPRFGYVKDTEAETE